MAGLRFTALQSRPMEFLDFTSLTLNEFQQLSYTYCMFWGNCRGGRHLRVR